ncbi:MULTISPECIES: ANTAR domain-containing protein [Pseudonocardia]|uniref:ANTAR domain protein n=2 Tax=Pseudonocardia TaxID=1847 RepID=A0A1Y2MJE2_PSEAH|nr:MULTISPECIES: ANTAR domain-containing protein [Pseudonocardia]OSY34568.1 ANTAR domain protein [Pseudonocardia autotrophica]TDN76354.1 ANTAR domain-containing protein [Pseudonocardia autotrophica]BBG00340.1 hypothetical protein Pdca_15490 [Pseudonocardia autotrophica]GEC29509.1 hypothetical protein PSA01_65380 [Pseudonocardia saturnea]
MSAGATAEALVSDQPGQHVDHLCLDGDVESALAGTLRPEPKPEPDLALGQALADVATIAILSEREIHRSEVVIGQLQHALQSRVIIELAEGIVANRLDVDMATAFEMLRTHSRRNNERLSTVAGQIVEGRRDLSILAPESGHGRAGA